ncbi:molybdopterin-dependent oxidoreductase [Microbacterium sp. CFH 31415]|uniref:molybdopterin-dependent oxidoreductase n=1 Tax=Microbacterium sp. CFH 31415 TaxID=2921732 RepID=UPI001F12E8B1|nr:molybdopterin-dependent oxidoreductase [Microbacterium sp. CFH 31415]MCH6229974.1 molybdopterin-dependent oxidoreductase [Microbacterium sp. CFH 31415]
MPDRGRAAGFMALSALAGVVSAGVFLAVAEVVALLVARESSPILAVGSFVIDVVPQPLKELAISTFGAYDKIALLVGLGIAVVIASAVAGVLQFLRPPLGVVALGLAAALSTAAIVTRQGASAWAWLPPLVGAGAGAALLVLAVGRLRRWADVEAWTAAQGWLGSTEDVESEREATATRSPRLDRRRFFQIVGVAGAGALVAGVAARATNVAVTSIASVRRALRLPEPRTRVTVPDGAEFDIPGLSPLYTPNADFYRVDTALTVPAIDPATWRLRVGGRVDEPVELSFDDLVAMGLDEYSITLTCVSNEVGGDLLGTAKWLGVPVRDVLALAGPRAGADMVLSRSVDGFTASTPLEALTDEGRDAILAVGMNGEALPLEHGFPVRMVVPGLYGYVSATKWLTELKVTTFAADEAYWTPRGYSARAPIKFSSRLDTPRTGQPVAAGTVVLAGVAWAQTVGIDSVEVRIDDGDWQQATLSSAVNDDTWVQWFLEWDAAPGNHDVVVRAVDRAGQLQIEERAAIAPDGSSGWQRTLVRVE